MTHPYGEMQIKCPACGIGELRLSRFGVVCPVENCDYNTHDS